MAYTLQVGSIRCHIVSDGIHLVDGGGFFGLVPKLLWHPVIRANEQNLIPAETRCLLIESAAGLILVDTGHGDKLAPKIQARLGIQGADRLVEDMGRVGFAPEDVDLVLLTHFHGDHAGGATRFHMADHMPSALAPTFPNATYLGQRLDLAEASFPNERTAATYDPRNWQPLLNSGCFRLVDGPQRLARGVRTDMAPGHTAALQAVWVEDGGESLLFLGDAASWAVHLERLAWVPSFDIYPMTSIETKRRLRQEASERNTLLVFQHDSQVVTGRLVEGPRGLQVQPEITEPGWR